MDNILTLAISSFFSILVAIITAYVTARSKTKAELEKEKSKRQLDVTMSQKYKYFLPFKYAADEFRRRLDHIIDWLSNPEHPKHEPMLIYMTQEVRSDNLEWYFNDGITSEIANGYYIASTIYMNCILFYWMKRILSEFPYIKLTIENVDKETIESLKQIINRDSELAKKESNFKIYDFIKNIKIEMGGNMGIPYALHDSIGDFMYDTTNDRVINYYEFSQQLVSKENKLKFEPVLSYWDNLVTNNGEIDIKRLQKIKATRLVLKMLDYAKISEN